MEGIFRDSVRVRAENALRAGKGARKSRSRFTRCRGKMANLLHTHIVLIILCVLVVVDASCVIGQILCDILIIQDKLKNSEVASDGLVSLLRDRFPAHLNDTNSKTSLPKLLEILKSTEGWNSTSIRGVEPSWNVTLDRGPFDYTTTKYRIPDAITTVTPAAASVTPALNAVGITNSVMANDPVTELNAASPNAAIGLLYQPQWNSMRGKVPPGNNPNRVSRVLHDKRPAMIQTVPPQRGVDPRFYAPPPKTRASPPNVRGVPMPGPYLPRPPMPGPASNTRYTAYKPRGSYRPNARNLAPNSVANRKNIPYTFTPNKQTPGPGITPPSPHPRPIVPSVAKSTKANASGAADPASVRAQNEIKLLHADIAGSIGSPRKPSRDRLTPPKLSVSLSPAKSKVRPVEKIHPAPKVQTPATTKRKPPPTTTTVTSTTTTVTTTTTVAPKTAAPPSRSKKKKVPTATLR